jgi:transcriptional regulator with XRE-family HTH domain
MQLAALIRQELEKRNIRTIKKAAQVLAISTESARLILNKGRIPKDRTLIRIAGALGLEPEILIMAGHRQKLPPELRGNILPIETPAGGEWKQKRKWPLSQEQSEYLGKILKPHEIQLIRKCRQLSPEEMHHAIAYIHYMFATKRVQIADRSESPRSLAALPTGEASSPG